MINLLKSAITSITQGRTRLSALFTLSAAECTFLPVPLELFLFPIMQYDRGRAWRIAITVTAGALAGAMTMYFGAEWLMNNWGNRLIAWFGGTSEQLAFEAFFAQNGFWALMAAGIFPIPFQLAILSAGATGYSLTLFALATVLSRGFRYFGIAALVLAFGDQAIDQFKRNKWRFGIFAAGMLVVAWIVFGAIEARLPNA